MTQQHTPENPQDGRSDFDFIYGTWRVQNRRLRERLEGSDSWEVFEGISVARPVLDRLGNIDEIAVERESGRLHGLTIRLFDPKSKQWRIYWADSVNGIFDLPMIGGFKERRGEFYAHEQFEGKYVYSRFIWSNITLTSCQWEQALSLDGGVSWETNWIMVMTRIE